MPEAPPVGVVHQADRGVGPNDGVEHVGGRRVVERGAGRGKSHADPRDHPRRRVADHRGIGLSHVPVTHQVGQRRQGLHQLRHVGPDRRTRLDLLHDLLDRGGQVGEHRAIEQDRQRRQVGLVLGAVGGEGRRGVLDSRPPEAGLDQRDGQLGRPLKSPRLLERPLARGLRHGPPAHAQQGQPVQQAAAVQIKVGSRRSSVLVVWAGGGSEPQPLLEPVQVLLQAGPLGVSSGTAPRRSPTISLRRISRIGVVFAEAEDRAGRLVQVGEIGQRAAPQGRQRVGQPNRLDHRGRRGVETLVAEQPGDLRHPPLDDQVRRGPEMVDTSPARRSPPRSRSLARAARRSRGPRWRRPSSWEGPARDGRLPWRRASFRLEAPGRARRRRPPRWGRGPRDRGANGLPHVGLAAKLPRVVLGGKARSNLAHRVEDRREQVGAVSTALDDELPPPLAVVESRRLGEQAERINPSMGRFLLVLVLLLVRVLVLADLEGDGQVDEPGRQAAIEARTQRLPLGRELGERVADRLLGVVGSIDQKGHRRRHLGVDQERDQGVGVGRSLDQNDARRDRLQSRA